MYSLKILKEAVVETTNPEHKLFEESIVLTRSFQVNNAKEYQKEILENITKQEPVYLNQYGERVFWKAMLIIDICELDFDLGEFEEYCEVFSRFIEMPGTATVQDVIQNFYSDYIWGEPIS